VRDSAKTFFARPVRCVLVYLLCSFPGTGRDR